jgi:DNA-binding GntR family transcriptional regulator
MLLLQTQTIRSYSLARYDAVRLRTEHGAIIAALHAGKPSALLRALRDHLLASRDEMLSRPVGDLPPRPG